MPVHNSKLGPKVLLRLEAVKSFADPAVIETHAGLGVLFAKCYQSMRSGLAFDLDKEKAMRLTLQRPYWRVYCGDSRKALAAGFDDGHRYNVLDVDAFGDPWPHVRALLAGPLPKDECMLVVTDGLKSSCRIGNAWRVETLKPYVRKMGVRLYQSFDELHKEIARDYCGAAGYECEVLKVASTRTVVYSLSRLVRKRPG